MSNSTGFSLSARAGAVGAALVVVLAVLAVLAGVREAAISPVSPQAETTPTQARSAPADLPPNLSTETVQQLLSEGVVVLPFRDSSRIAESEAVKSASAAFGFLAKDPTEAELVEVTVEGYGKPVDPTLQSSGDVTPTIKSRAAWAVVYDSVQVPILGPAGGQPPESGAGRESSSSRFLVLVDSDSGAFLLAESF